MHRLILQDDRGNPLASHAILPPAVRLRVHYTAGEDTVSNDINNTIRLHPDAGILLLTPRSTANSRGSRLSQVSDTVSPKSSPRTLEVNSKMKPSAVSSAPVRLKLCIVQIRDLHVRTNLGHDSGNTLTQSKVQIFVNLFEEETIYDNVAGMMDHAVSQQEQLALQGGNFCVTLNGHFSLRPQCATPKYDLISANAVWNYEVGVYSTYPTLRQMYKGFKNGKAQLLNQEIMIRGQRVVAFLTLRIFFEDETSAKIASAVVPVSSPETVESWHLLLGASGEPLRGPNGREAMICLRAEYSEHASTALGLTASPTGTQQSSSRSSHQSVMNHCRISPVRCQTGVVQVRLLRGRNFGMLIKPNDGAIMCELVCQVDKREIRVGKSNKVACNDTPDFKAEKLALEVEYASLVSGVLKINVMHVKSKDNKEHVELIGKMRRIKLGDVLDHGGSLHSFFQVLGKPSCTKEPHNQNEIYPTVAELSMEINLKAPHVKASEPRSPTPSTLLPRSPVPKSPERARKKESAKETPSTTMMKEGAASSICAQWASTCLIGVGLVLATGLDGDHVVAEVIKGGSADRSGKFVPGDVVTEVDGIPIAKKPLSEIQQLLSGPASSPVTITVARSTKQKVSEVTHNFCVYACARLIPIVAIFFLAQIGPV